MRLLNFVKQHNRVWTSANALRKLTAFFKAHVSWRRANQARNVVFLHVFAHIQGVQRVLIAKHKVGDGFGQQRFTNAGWAKEQE